MRMSMAMEMAFALEAKASWEVQITVFVRTIVCSFTERQLHHINGEGAHCALSHQCACGENLKWILDKQLEFTLLLIRIGIWIRKGDS